MGYFYFYAFEKVSDLYSFLHQISGDHELIECGQLHRGLFTLLLKTANPLPKPVSCVDFFETTKDTTSLLASYHKQTTIDVTDGLLLLESENLSTLFSFLTTTSMLPLSQLLEVSRSALPGGLAQAVFVNVRPLDLKTLPSGIHSTYFQKPGPALLSLFKVSV